MDHSLGPGFDTSGSNIKATTIEDYFNSAFEESLGAINLVIDSPAHSMEYTIPKLEKLAKIGSVKAKEYAEGLKLCTWIVRTLRKEEDTGKLMFDNDLQDEMVIKLGKAYELDHLLPEWLPNELLIPMVSISATVLRRQRPSTKSEVDKAVRVCQTHFYSASSSKDKGLKLAEESIKKYPHVEYFYFMKGVLLGALNKMDEGLKSCNEALEKFPKGLLILKNKSRFLNNLPKVSVGRKLEVYMMFLTQANISERHVPLYWYGICELIITKYLLNAQTKYCKSFTRGLNMLKNAYAKAQIAEGHILPCNTHDGLELLSDILFVTSMISQGEKELLQLQVEDLVIREMILDIRALLYAEAGSLREFYETELSKVFNFDYRTLSPKSVASSVMPKNLEPIFLEDMIPDGPMKSYRGRVIKFTSIEKAFFLYSNTSGFLSITVIVEDITGDIAQCQIVNYTKIDTSYDEECVDENIQKIFGIGCKFSVCNPEYCSLECVNRGCRRFIVVNGSCPYSIILHPEERIERLCNYCSMEISPTGSNLRCNKCKKAYYCDSHCQKRDWKVFGHRSYCKSMAN